MEEIINKVANSVLEVFDLEDYYPTGTRTQIDISQWLLEGFLLKEKDFREALKNHDWKQYENHFVAINCSKLRESLFPLTENLPKAIAKYQFAFEFPLDNNLPNRTLRVLS